MRKLRSMTMALILGLGSAALAGAALAHDGARLQDKGPFTLKKLTDAVYVLYGRGGNIGFAVTGEGVVVVDDQFADLAPGIAEQIKSVTSEPIRYLINTHHHGDHTGGNKFFIKMTTIVAHDNVRKHMLAQPQEIIASVPAQVQSLETQIAKLEKENSGASDLPGLRQLEAMKKNLADARSMKVSDIPAPSLTFSREVKMYLGGKEIQVFHVKRGHTDGDSIIYFVQDKVVHMGDLFFHKVIPFIDRAHGASTSEWIETIDGVVARVDGGSQVIPGHGQVTTIDELKAFKQYFVDLRAAVKEAFTAGMTRDQAIQRVKLAKYSEYNGYDQRFSQNVGVVYDEIQSEEEAARGKRT